MMIRMKRWGWYKVIYRRKKYKVKILFIRKNRSISLQYHNYRSEKWLVIKGKGVFTLNETRREMKENDECFIPVLSLHRYEALEDTIILEIQKGDKVEENDIVRLLV